MLPSFPRAIIFDWDNTLVDNWPVIATAINATFAKYGLPVCTLDEVKQRCNRAARDSFPEWFGENWQDAHDFFYAQFEVIHLTMLEKLPGAEALLHWLYTQKLPLFVVSNKRGDYLRQQADALKWTKYFVALVGSQDASRDKPERDPVDKALAHAAMLPDSNVWFVGDTAIDMLCAKNAGCFPIFIGSQVDIAALNPPLAFSNCQDLEILLKDIQNKEKNR